MMRPCKQPGVYTDGRAIFTKSFSPGKKVYGERLATHKGKEYRQWSPRRSKLSAYLTRGGDFFPFKRETRVLYVGAASGTTASHVADIVDRGQVYCVEFSPRSFRDLVEITRDRPHMIPILADARKPDGYGAIVGEADILYQDVSQRDQLDIFLKNAQSLLSSKGSGFLMLKARSIDSSANPKKLYEDAVRTLAKEGYALEAIIELTPMQKDHAAIVVSRRK